MFAILGLRLAVATAVPVSMFIAQGFKRERGIAIYTASTDTSLGGMVMNPVNTYLLQAYGRRQSYVILAIAPTIVTVPVVLFGMQID